MIILIGLCQCISMCVRREATCQVSHYGIIVTISDKEYRVSGEHLREES